MSATKLHALLTLSEDLAPLATHAARLMRLQRIFQQIAPKPLARSSQVANLKQGVVIVHAANGAVAAKLRQLAPRLCDEFSNRSCEITKIQVKVQAPANAGKSLKIERPELAPAAIQELARLSGRLPDSPLKRAVDRMLARQDARKRPPPKESSGRPKAP